MRMNRFFLVCFGIILILLIFYLASLVDFIFQPLISLFNIVIIPLLLAGFFYYLLRPLITVMERWKWLSRTVAILLVFAVLGGLLAAFSSGVWPSLQSQIMHLVNVTPNLLNTLGRQLQELESSGFLADIIPENVSLFATMTEYLNSGFNYLTGYVSGLFSFVSNFAIVLFTFPIILFFMLKEGGKIGKKIVGALPRRFQGEGSLIMADIDKALSGFIVGRVIVNVALGVLMYLGFLIIGLPYALVLTIMAVIMNFIPFFGAIISSVPIVIIGFLQSPGTAIWSLVIILVAQQIQDNLIAPYIFGKQLDIHPLTTILLILVGGDLAGIIGIIIIIPVYMMIKIVAVRVYRLFFQEKWENA